MLDPKITEILALQEAEIACEHPEDQVYLAHIGQLASTRGLVYHTRCSRQEAESLIECFPAMYRLADGPDGIDDEAQPWAVYDDAGNIIDTKGSLDDPAERFTPEDVERILAYRAETTPAERRAHRQSLFARCRR